MGKQPIFKPPTDQQPQRAKNTTPAQVLLHAALGLILLLTVQFPVRSAPVGAQEGTAWRGEYYAGTDLIGAPALVREDRDPNGTPGIDFDWGAGAPAEGLPADGFSARWTKRETFEAGAYRFQATADDGIRLFVDGELVIDAWRKDGPREVRADRSLTAGQHSLRVEYFEGVGSAVVKVHWEPVAKAQVNTGAWQVEYFDNPDLSGPAGLVRKHTGTDGTLGLNLDWGARPPARGFPADGFSVRWTRSLPFEQGLYRFRASVDDGMRVWIDAVLVIDEWRNGVQRETVAEHVLEAGEHNLRVEYYDHSGLAAARLHWVKITPAALDDPAWKGQYWDNPDLAGDPALERDDPVLAFEWGRGTPGQAIPQDSFSARWSRTVNLEEGVYRFYMLVDDGIRLRLNDRTIVDEWSNRELAWLQEDLTLYQGRYTVQVDYLDRVGDARVRVAWQRIAPLSFADWKGEYWSNRFFHGDPAVVRNDPSPDEKNLGFTFDWGTGMPSPDLPIDCFAVRWTRTLDFKGGTYEFYAVSDDGIRVWVDGQQLIDSWRDQGPTELTGQAELEPGEHEIVVEYYEQHGSARVRFWWERIAGQ
jgi:hypothetical protein